MNESTDRTPAPGKRALKREETTQRILDAAMAILIAEGLDAFTIARLASDLGYAVGALYRYFRGKDAIIAALQRRVVEQLESDIVAALAVAEERPEADAKEHALYRLFVALEVYSSLTARRPTNFHVLALSLGDPRTFMAKDVVDARLVPAYQSLLERIGAELDRCVEVGALRDGERRKRIVALWGATQGVMSLRKLARFADELAAPEVAAEVHMGLAAAWGANAPLSRLHQKSVETVATLSSER